MEKAGSRSPEDVGGHTGILGWEKFVGDESNLS